MFLINEPLALKRGMSITFLRRKEKGASVQYSKSDLPVIMFYSRILYKFAYLLQTGKIFFY